VRDLDEITVVTVTDVNRHLDVKRVVDWILKGEAIFFDAGKLEVVGTDENNNRRIIPYDARIYANDMSCRTTIRTHACFTEEAELYKFSIVALLPDLQAALSRRFRSQYQVYVAELIHLFKTLYTSEVFISTTNLWIWDVSLTHAFCL
jgi:hypothetical protein